MSGGGQSLLVLMRRCELCRRALAETCHRNRKRCERCASVMRREPAHNLTVEQQKKVVRLAGRMSRTELAENVGASAASCSRFARDKGISLNAFKYTDAIVKKVTAYYSCHGAAKTENKFPEVCVRSIVERNPTAARQRRWTDKELISAARMAGFVSFHKQALSFNRPGANAGSIKSLWIKRMRSAPVTLHGLAAHNAAVLLKPDVPLVCMGGVMIDRKTTKGRPPRYMKIALWCDAEQHMRIDIPEFLAEAIGAMASFQRWLYCSRRPQQKIMALIRRYG